jgi:hypothetical protein
MISVPLAAMTLVAGVFVFMGIGLAGATYGWAVATALAGGLAALLALGVVVMMLRRRVGSGS